MKGYGWEPYFVEGEDIDEMQEKMAKTLDEVITKIKELRAEAQLMTDYSKLRFPMIVFRTPKGWTGPK